jgi:hypothetical protein
MNSAKAKREIIGLALLVDEITDLAVFVRYHPHVSLINVDVAKSKKEWKEKVFEGEFYCDPNREYYNPERELERYNRIKEFLTDVVRKATEIPSGLAQ